jgi:hypothetical protein
MWGPKRSKHSSHDLSIEMRGYHSGQSVRVAGLGTDEVWTDDDDDDDDQGL